MLYQNINSITFINIHNFSYIDIEYICTISTFYFRNMRNIKISFLSKTKIFKKIGGWLRDFPKDNIKENHAHPPNREIKIKNDNTVTNILWYMVIT